MMNSINLYSWFSENRRLLSLTLVAGVAITGCSRPKIQPKTAESSVETTTVKSLPLPEGYGSATLIDNLEDGDRFNQFRGTWFTYDDRYQNGDSQVIPRGYSAFRPATCTLPPEAQPSQRCAKIQGTVTTTFPDGFVGVGIDLNSQNTRPRDLSEYDAIEFWTKGDGKPYRVKIHSAATSDYDDYGYNFIPTPEWQRQIIPLSELTQEGWGQAVDRQQALKQALKIQWQTIGQPHESVEIAVDNIRLLKAQ